MVKPPKYENLWNIFSAQRMAYNFTCQQSQPEASLPISLEWVRFLNPNSSESQTCRVALKILNMLQAEYIARILKLSQRRVYSVYRLYLACIMQSIVFFLMTLCCVKFTIEVNVTGRVMESVYSGCRIYALTLSKHFRGVLQQSD